MRFENEGMSLWYGTPDAHAPAETVQEGNEITITIGVQPADASNRVEVLYRINQGPTQAMLAKWVRNDHSGKVQYFRVKLPAFRANDSVEYIAICRCAGRQVPSSEEGKQLVSSFTVASANATPRPDLTSKEIPLREPHIVPDPRTGIITPAELPQNSSTSALNPPEATSTRPGRNDRERQTFYGFPAVVTAVSPRLEPGAIRGLNNNIARQLNNAGVASLADLRRVSIDRVAQQTGLPNQELNRYRAAARLQAIGVSPDVAHALARLGDINGPAELMLTSRERLEEIIESGRREGLISGEEASVTGLADNLLATATAATRMAVDAYLTDRSKQANTCQAECPDELSALGCFAYMLELASLTQMSWSELNKAFKQDFLSVTGSPARRIDVSTRVLERALTEDLGSPPPLGA